MKSAFQIECIIIIIQPRMSSFNISWYTAFANPKNTDVHSLVDFDLVSIMLWVI